MKILTYQEQFCRKKLEQQMKGFEDAFDHRNAGKPMAEESAPLTGSCESMVTSQEARLATRQKKPSIFFILPVSG